MENYMRLEFPSKSQNESFARTAVAAFATQLDITVDEMADIKTAVSEAVTNAIVHGYRDTRGVICISAKIDGGEIEITVEDKGRGIEDVHKAMQPLYTTCAEDERSGMGFTIMETFMDRLAVTSEMGAGTKVVMTKTIANNS